MQGGMPAGMRRLAGPLGAVLQESGAAALSGGGGSGSCGALRRAADTVLRQLHEAAAGARSQGQAAGPLGQQQQQLASLSGGRSAGGCGPRGYSSAHGPGQAHPRTQQPQGAPAGQQAQGGDDGRVKPRFLMERLGLAQPSSRPSGGASAGAGGGAGGGGSGEPHSHRSHGQGHGSQARGPHQQRHREEGQQDRRPQYGRGQDGSQQQQGDRLQYSRPYNGSQQQGDRPQYSRPHSGTQQQQGDRPQYSRPRDGTQQQGDRPQYSRPHSGTQQQQGDRPQYSRPRDGTQQQGDRPQYSRPHSGTQQQQGDRPQYSRPRDGTQGDRPQYSRPHNGTQQQGDRPQYSRPHSGTQQQQGDRPQYSRPHNGTQQQGDRPQYSRPHSGTQQQQGDRPQYSRPRDGTQQQGDRPQYSRPHSGTQQQQGDRPQYSRPHSGTQQQGDRPQYSRPHSGSQQPQQQGGRRPQHLNGAVNGAPRNAAEEADVQQQQQGRFGRGAPPQHQHGRRPHDARAGTGEAGAEGFIPFSFPAELPTEFPTAFPRQGGPGQRPPGFGGPGGGKKKAQKAAAAALQPDMPEEVAIPEDVDVQRLAQLLGEEVKRVAAVLEELGESVSSYHDLVPPDAAELAAMEFGKIAVLQAGRGGGRRAAPLDADATPRPAVVTVMGHVDHGKTTLLDALRKTSVAAGEAGGITQHIGAFQVTMPGSKASLTFLDTPGHAAFSAMRARGAAVTDLVVLVVAADDGIMPQTREAISHARAAGCPIVVAITKCDAPTAQPERVRKQLVGTGLELEDVGGNVQVVQVAAVKGEGLEELEEALLLQAELMELRASRSRRAEGVVIEARVDKGQGPVATVVVKRGTLKVGQPMVVGAEWGRVRSLRGTGGATVEEVLPGQPAEIAGLKGLPQAGDQLLVVDSEERAQVISKARTSNAEFHRRAALARLVAADQERVAAAAGDEGGEAGGEVQQRTLPLIIKADVQGSAEAVREAVSCMATEHVRVQVVHVGVGPVSQSDVQLAVPLGAKILGFNVRTAAGDVEALAKQHGVEVRCQRVIYGILEDVGALLVGASPKVEVEVVAGTAEVLTTFPLKGNRGKEAGVVAGCRVTEGSIKGSLRYRVLRGGEPVHTGRCSSLKRHKLEVETVGKGTECGVLLHDYTDFKPGDVLQCITVEMRASDKVTGANAAAEKKW